jgi:hypothetical protein
VAARLLLAAAGLAAAAPAGAGRPFATEDAGVLGRGECELESAVTRASARGEPRETAASAQFGCGLGAAWQLGLGASRTRSAGERSDGVSLAGKAGMHNVGEAAPALTLAWGLGWSRAGGATGFDGGFAMLVASQSVADGWTLHGNLGAVREHAERKTRGAWAVLVERIVAEGLDLGVEAYGLSGDRPWLGLGVRWTPGTGWQFDASLARRRGGTSHAASAASLGLKFSF